MRKRLPLHVIFDETGKLTRCSLHHLLRIAMKKRTTRRVVLFTNIVSIFLFLAIENIEARPAASPAPQVIGVKGDVQGTHDPSIIQDGNTWYLFATTTERNPSGEIPIRCSRDLHEWQRCGYVLPGIPDWICKISPKTRNLWAPDISYFDGLYHLYYAYSSFGVNTSGIALLTNKTLDPKSPQYHWEDDGLVIESKATDDYNAIDPNLILDAKGEAWLSFGSFWGGIKMRKLDRKTGKLAADDTKLYSLAKRAQPDNPPPAPPGLPANWQAIEAPFIVLHNDAHGGSYYYLFVSFDLCCRGTKSTYKTMVGRAREVIGPYLDKTGKPMSEGGGSALLIANQRWLGPGGESVHLGKDRDIIVFHAYDATTGHPSLQISTLTWKDGWPEAALEGSADPGTSLPKP
jgi:arabinan endo-1,5-alpha-L-arabinosidase